MEDFLNVDITSDKYESIEQYKINIEHVLLDMLSKNERFVFAHIAERAGVTRFVIRHYPELRDYILHRIKYYEDSKIITKKINDVVSNLKKSNKTITFMSIMNKCKFDLSNNDYKELVINKIRNVLINLNK